MSSSCHSNCAALSTAAVPSRVPSTAQHRPPIGHSINRKPSTAFAQVYAPLAQGAPSCTTADVGFELHELHTCCCICSACSGVMLTPAWRIVAAMSSAGMSPIIFCTIAIVSGLLSCAIMSGDSAGAARCSALVPAAQNDEHHDNQAALIQGGS